MAVPIIPRLVRGRLYFEIGPVLFPTFAQAATARFERPEDNGKRVRIAGFDPNNDGYHFECESLDGPIQCEGGSFATMIWFKPEELRRLWTGNTAPAKVGVL